jgi:sensor histidine kinase YesM
MKTREGGIGLDNVRRRLDILYGDDKLLVTSQKDNIYKVRLTIPKI